MAIALGFGVLTQKGKLYHAYGRAILHNFLMPQKRDNLRQTFDESDAEEALASFAGETTASSEAVSGVM